MKKGMDIAAVLCYNTKNNMGTYANCYAWRCFDG